jgi:hypothetical protein
VIEMARIKIDWTKVEMAGPVEAPALVGGLPEAIKPNVVSGGIKTKLAKVTLNVGEGDSAKMYGAAFLRITESDDASVDSILSAIKAAGKNAVIDSYNGIQRDARLAYLTGAFGDVTAAIQEAVDSMVANGFDATEARDLVLAKRAKAGLRV